MTATKTARIVAQALPVLLIALMGELFAGSVFGRMRGLLDATPGLLALVPALLALRGNINTALASRLSTAVHLGLVPAHVPWDQEVRNNLNASILLGVIMGTFAGVLAHGATLAFGTNSAGIGTLATIGGGVGFLSGVAMAPVTTRAVRMAFHHGIDPDNVVGPALLTLGDILTIVLLFGAAFAMQGVSF